MTLALLTAVSVSAQSRKGYKGQLHVSHVEVFSQAGEVHLKMRVAYNSDLLNRGEKLYVSPRLEKDGQICQFGAMVFDGMSRTVRVRDREVIVVADEGFGQLLFDIEYVSGYAGWMQDIDLRFFSEEVSQGQLLGKYTDTLFEGMLVPMKNGEWKMENE